MKYRVVVEGRVFEIEVESGGRVWVNRRPLSVDLGRIDGLPLYSLLVDNRSYEAHVDLEETGECRVVVAGRLYRPCLREDRGLSAEKAGRHRVDGPTRICAPLPGLLVEVRVKEGQRVEDGDVVAVLESMKMHMELRTSQPGVVSALRAAAGQEVAQGDVLAVIDCPRDGER